MSIGDTDNSITPVQWRWHSLCSCSSVARYH